MSYQGFHLKDVVSGPVTLPTPAQIFDATQCVKTGINPNTSGTIGPDGEMPWTTLPEQSARDREAIRFSAPLTTARSTPSVQFAFVHSHHHDGTANITGENPLDLNNFHVKFDYIFSSVASGFG